MKILFALKDLEKDDYLIKFYADHLLNKEHEVIIAKVFVQPYFPIEDYYPGPILLAEKFVSAVCERQKVDKNQLKMLKDRMAQTLGVNVDYKLLDPRSNTVGQAIVLYCEQTGIDLVILGSGDSTGIKSFLLGTTASYVVHHSRIPVTICPTVHVRTT